MKKPYAHRAKKSLGQNFLKSPLAANTLVKSAGIEEGDHVLEVGPGKGVLTKLLLASGAHVTAVEKDDDLFTLLKETYKEEILKKKLTLVHGDILNFSPVELSLKEGYLVVGSIPYNITGIFIRTILTNTPPPKTLALIIQKEVAERIVERNGKKSLLSLSVRAFGEPEYIKTVKAGAFSPTPKVDSAVLVVKNISREFFSGFNEEEFFLMLKRAYAQKRKKVISNLKEYYGSKELENAFTHAGIKQDARAEEISLSTWKILAHELFVKT